jgi:hypothetical protein
MLVTPFRDVFQPLGKWLVGLAICIIPKAAAFGQVMKGTDLSRHDADDQPVFTDFNEDDAFTRAKGNATDDFHATLAKALDAGKLAQQPSGAKQQADDQGQGKACLHVGTGRDGASSLGGMDRKGEKQEKKSQRMTRQQWMSGRYLNAK